MINTIDFQEKFLGVKEIKGAESNPFILRIIKWILPEAKDDSGVAWCAIWVVYVLFKLNVFTINDIIKHGKKLVSSRYVASLLEATNIPEKGDIVLLWRESPESWKGHIAFFQTTFEEFVYLRGGNQNDSVSDARFLKSRVLGYYKPKKK